MVEKELVNHPDHYNAHPSGIECIEIVRHMSFNLGNVVKYIWRDGLKDTEVPLQDLRKAAWYLEDEIKMREKRQGERCPSCNEKIVEGLHPVNDCNRTPF